jgi:hypothetical protein
VSADRSGARFGPGRGPPQPPFPAPKSAHTARLGVCFFHVGKKNDSARLVESRLWKVVYHNPETFESGGFAITKPGTNRRRGFCGNLLTKKNPPVVLQMQCNAWTLMRDTLTVAFRGPETSFVAPHNFPRGTSRLVTLAARLVTLAGRLVTLAARLVTLAG